MRTTLVVLTALSLATFCLIFAVPPAEAARCIVGETSDCIVQVYCIANCCNTYCCYPMECAPQ